MWQQKFLVFLFAAIAFLNVILAFAAFKWYRILLLKCHAIAEETKGNPIPPANTHYPSQNQSDNPPPSFEKPVASPSP